MSAAKSIVLVDDEPILVRVLTRILSRVGAPVRGFTDPHLALRFIQENDIAVVLCDHRMPGMTGLELLTKVGKDVAFYIVSGDLALDPGLVRPGLSGVLGKPVTTDELIALVERHL